MPETKLDSQPAWMLHLPSHEGMIYMKISIVCKEALMGKISVLSCNIFGGCFRESEATGSCCRVCWRWCGAGSSPQPGDHDPDRPVALWSRLHCSSRGRDRNRFSDHTHDDQSQRGHQAVRWWFARLVGWPYRS